MASRRSLSVLLAAALSGVSPLAAAAGPEPVDFELAGSGRFVRLSALPPQTTLVNFWRSDCPPCVRELPLLAELARRGKIRVITVALQRPWETASSPAAVLDALEAPMLALHGPSDPRGLLARFGDPRGALPHSVLLDPARRPCGQRSGELSPAWLADAQARCPAP